MKKSEISHAVNMRVLFIGPIKRELARRQRYLASDTSGNSIAAVKFKYLVHIGQFFQ